VVGYPYVTFVYWVETATDKAVVAVEYH